MQDNFDKILKEKLEGFRPEFNSDHWSDMEARLDGQRRKPFAWWTYSALLLALLTVGAMGFYYMQYISNNEFVAGVDGVTGMQEQVDPGNKRNLASEVNTPPIDQSGEQSNTDPWEPKRLQKEGNSQSTRKSKDVADGQQKSQVIPERKVAISKDDSRHQGIAVAPVNIVPKREDRTNKQSVATNQNLPSDPSSILESPISLSNNVLTTKSAPFAVTALTAVKSEVVYHPDEPMDDVTALVEDDEIELPKPKHIDFYVSPEAGISESFIDNTRFSKPGYSVGLHVEVLYKQVVGLSTGINFTDLNYGTRNVICEDNARYVCPLAYKSNIKALEIPIDLRLNLLHINRWRFFVSTGISHFVKLEESFGYDLPLQNTIPAQLPPSRNVPFNQSSTGLQSAQQLYEETSTDFSLSDVKRYHLGYRAAIGTEYRLTESMSISIQPNFGFSVKQVGIQDKRLFTYGARGRINFIF